VGNRAPRHMAPSLRRSPSGRLCSIVDAPYGSRNHRARVIKFLPAPYVVGLDLAKQVFQIHVSTADGVRVSRERFRRDEVLPYFEDLPASLVGMEACVGAHYWAAAIRERGHSVRLLHPLTVSRFRQQQKNDRNDAGAIALAARLPEIRSVPWKSPDQQAVLALHAMRNLVVADKVASANQLLGLLSEFGDVAWTSHSQILAASDDETALHLRSVPAAAAAGMRHLISRIRYLAGQAYALELHIERWHQSSQESQLVATIPRVGVLSATSIVAALGNDRNAFQSGREASAWLGLVPTQHSSGETVRLGRIRKGGNQHLRRVLYNVGSYSILDVYRRGDGPKFLVAMMHKRKPHKLIAIAMANKVMRTAWTMLRDGKPFEVRGDWETVPFHGTERPGATSVGEDRDFGSRAP
jgi:transposase